MKLLLVMLCLTLSSCSLVQWLPSSNCEYVEYVRVQNQVSVKAECQV